MKFLRCSLNDFEPLSRFVYAGPEGGDKVTKMEFGGAELSSEKGNKEFIQNTGRNELAFAQRGLKAVEAPKSTTAAKWDKKDAKDGKTYFINAPDVSVTANKLNFRDENNLSVKGKFDKGTKLTVAIDPKPIVVNGTTLVLVYDPISLGEKNKFYVAERFLKNAEPQKNNEGTDTPLVAKAPQDRVESRFISHTMNSSLLKYDKDAQSLTVAPGADSQKIRDTTKAAIERLVAADMQKVILDSNIGRQGELGIKLFGENGIYSNFNLPNMKFCADGTRVELDTNTLRLNLVAIDGDRQAWNPDRKNPIVATYLRGKSNERTV